MCEIYACIFTKPAATGQDYQIFQSHGNNYFGNSDGWGVFTQDKNGVNIVKNTVMSAIDPTWPDHSNSNLSAVIAHLREASEGKIEIENCQPYIELADSLTLCFAHNGACEDLMNDQHLWPADIQPKGSSDSEIAFIMLRKYLCDIDDSNPQAVHDRLIAYIKFLRPYGPTNLVIKVNDFYMAYADVRKPVGKDELHEPGLYVQQTDNHIAFSSEPLAGHWTAMKSGDYFFTRSTEILHSASITSS